PASGLSSPSVASRGEVAALAAQAAPVPTDAPAAPTADTAAAPAVSSEAAASAGVIPGAPPQTGAAPDEVECPQCGHRNKLGNRFCASCGFNIGSASTGAAVAARAPSPSGSPGPTVSVSLTALRADGSEAGTFTLPPKAL